MSQDHSSTAALSLGDIVQIIEIPEHYYSDPGIDPLDADALKSYSGRYGLVTMFQGQPILPGTHSWPSWKSRDDTHYHVTTKRPARGAISTFDFWLPKSALRKLPYNLLLYMALSSTSDCERGEAELGASAKTTRAFMVSILDAPHDRLAELHDLLAHQLAPRS